MDESLKSIRAIHQILIVVCAAIGIFAFSIEPPENIYDRVKKGIIAIQKGIENEINSPLGNEILVDNMRGESSFQMIIFNNLPKLNLDTVQIKNILPDDNFIDKSLSKINIKKINPNCFQTWFSNYMDLSKKSNKISRNFFVMLYDTIPVRPNFVKLTIYIDSTLNYMKDNFSETDKLVKLQRKYLSKDSITVKPIFESLCEKLIKESDTLQVDFTNNKVYTEENYAGNLLNSPEFIPVLDKIRLLTFSAAYKELQSLSDEQQKTGNTEALDILGLKVASKTAVIVSPIIIAFLLLYLITLIIHLDKVYSIEKGSVETFPWLGLFNNIFSRVILILSVWFLPIGGILLLVYKSGLSLVNKLQFSGIYLIIFSIISMVILKKIFRFQKKIISSSLDNDNLL